MANKLRILCLHGFTSNGSVHAYQVRKIIAKLSAADSNYEFLFPDGPHAVDLSEMESKDPTTKRWRDYVAAHSTSGHRAWWFARDSTRAGEPGEFYGLEKSLKYLGELIERTGPVHAVWGFSQGAGFAGMLTALLSSYGLEEHPLRRHIPSKQGRLMAGIFFSGFKARFPIYDSLYAVGIETPTLHVIGEQDLSVTPERSGDLVKCCRDARVLRHAGGHDIPKAEEDQEVIVQFVRDNVKVKESGSL